jgi:polycystin 1L2
LSFIVTGGYVKDLIGERQRVEGFVQELESLGWLDQFSRSFFVEFVLYNANINLFAMVIVVFETPITGNFQAEVRVHSFR